MSVAGSDDLADAPTLTVGTASAYTPNTGFSLETGEPAALSGRTAWWRLAPTVGVVNWVDALYSQTTSGAAASTRVWVYLTDADAPGFADLTQLVAGGTDERLGFVGSGSFDYYLRVDTASTAPVSYCVALGVEQYDQIVARVPLGGPLDSDGVDPTENVLFGHFTGSPLSLDPDTEDDEAHDVRAAFNSAVGIVGGTSWTTPDVWPDHDALDTEDTDSYAVLDAVRFHNGRDLAHQNQYGHGYLDPLGISVGHDHATDYASLALASTSRWRNQDGPSVVVPVGYTAGLAHLVFIMRALAPDPQTIDADESGVLTGISVSGQFSSGSVRHFDDNQSVAGDLAVDGTWRQFRLRFPAAISPDEALNDYNIGAMVANFAPVKTNVSLYPPPAAEWDVAFIGLDITFVSDDPLPYEPPPAPPLAVEEIRVTRQFPRDDEYGLGSAPRIFPPPRRGRVVGGYQ